MRLWLRRVEELFPIPVSTASGFCINYIEIYFNTRFRLPINFIFLMAKPQILNYWFN